MGKLPTMQQLRQLKAAAGHVKLIFRPEHLAPRSERLCISALRPECIPLARFADTVIFKSANGEDVTLKPVEL